MRISRRHFRLIVRCWMVAVGSALAVLVVVATGAVLSPRHGPAEPAVHTIAVPPATAAAEQRAASDASPAPGVTGTTALPTMAIPAAATLGNAGITPARPFAMIGVAMPQRVRALECLTAAIYYEAASEPDAGQAAVAQVVLNRVRHPAFPPSVCGVVFQGADHAGCQFSFACDGSTARIPNAAGWARAARHASAALAGYVYAPVGLATHYHTYAVTPAWNRSLVMTDVVGAHFFHRWKGYWGTSAAFSQRYAGLETLPTDRIMPPAEPLPAQQLPDLLPAPDMALPAPSPEREILLDRKTPGASTASVPTPIADPAAPAAGQADRLPPPATVLDRWKDSGKPLR